jgi:hypothetical protein
MFLMLEDTPELLASTYLAVVVMIGRGIGLAVSGDNNPHQIISHLQDKIPSIS